MAPQNQNRTGATQRSISIITRLNPSYIGVGGDIKQSYIMVLECEFRSDSNATVDSVNAFDTFLVAVFDALQGREQLDRLQQRQSIKLDKGITDVKDYPFIDDEPGLFKKIITIVGYEIR